MFEARIRSGVIYFTSNAKVKLLPIGDIFCPAFRLKVTSGFRIDLPVGFISVGIKLIFSLKTRTDILSKLGAFFMNNGRWTKTVKKVITNVIYSHRNPIEMKYILISPEAKM